MRVGCAPRLGELAQDKISRFAPAAQDARENIDNIPYVASSMRPGILFLDQPDVNLLVQLVQSKYIQAILDMKEKVPTNINCYFDPERLWPVQEGAVHSLQVTSRKSSCLGFTTVAVTFYRQCI